MKTLIKIVLIPALVIAITSATVYSQVPDNLPPLQQLTPQGQQIIESTRLDYARSLKILLGGSRIHSQRAVAHIYFSSLPSQQEIYRAMQYTNEYMASLDPSGSSRVYIEDFNPQRGNMARAVFVNRNTSTALEFIIGRNDETNTVGLILFYRSY
jgi:hypothetical protein